MSTQKITELLAEIALVEERRPGGRAKKTLSRVSIRVPGTRVLVATRTIPGKWDAAHALTEFRRFPQRFQLNPEGVKQAEQLNLI